ncbi:MAG: serine--tRNA ligase [Bryobacterales bacterium]
MLDLNYLRQHFDEAKQRLAGRGGEDLLDQLQEVDASRRAAVTEIEGLKGKRNEFSAQVARAKREGGDAEQAILESRQIGEKIKSLEDNVKELDDRLQQVLSGIPNLPHPDVPRGADASANVEVRRAGEPRKFDFEPKPHWDVAPALGILDFDRAAKITGARFAVYWNAGAKLERALLNFMLDVHTREHGYTEVLPPFIVNSNSLYGTGQLPKFGADLFRLADTDYWLIPTAEVPVTNLFADETLEASQLPIRLAAYTPCFRSEAGSYGRDVRGIIRQHQFQKVEMVKFATPEQSYDELESLTADAEDILKRLGLPYRTMLLCSGDLGFGSAKTYDIEVWLPGLNEFKEISSCSNYESFQARRAKIRYRDASKKGKAQLVHTLNGSGLAIGRTWVAIVENYQQSDGTVVIPEALRPYLNAERIVAGGELK